jgi:hypothetical protein
MTRRRSAWRRVMSVTVLVSQPRNLRATVASKRRRTAGAATTRSGQASASSRPPDTGWTCRCHWHRSPRSARRAGHRAAAATGRSQPRARSSPPRRYSARSLAHQTAAGHGLPPSHASYARQPPPERAARRPGSGRTRGSSARMRPGRREGDLRARPGLRPAPAGVADCQVLRLSGRTARSARTRRPSPQEPVRVCIQPVRPGITPLRR